MFERCTLDIDLSVRHLCTKPYHNHPKGCPKYGKSILCPPEAPVITTIFNLQLPVYAIWTSYDLRLHTNRLKAKHPSWTWPQLVCCLYWQGSARRALRQECREFVEWRKRRDSIDRSLPAMVVSYCPEANGINVTNTMASLGIKLEWPPVNIAYQVAIAGYRKEVIADTRSLPVASSFLSPAPT